MSKQIKTYLKFQRSDRNVNAFVSYVRKENGSWKGCRESDGCKKKVVLADNLLAATLLENVLYCAILVPMRECMGFVAISAEPVRFKARIESVISYERYAVYVKFGNKTITYDPESPLNMESSIDSIVATLRKRIDLRDTEHVVHDFKEAAETVLAYYRADSQNQ